MITGIYQPAFVERAKRLTKPSSKKRRLLSALLLTLTAITAMIMAMVVTGSSDSEDSWGGKYMVQR